MSNADVTRTSVKPPISVASDLLPHETLIQRGAFEPPLVPGTIGKLERFDLLRMIGMGGMGLVYLGREPVTETRVAIKILRPELADDPEASHKFLTEARHMYRLFHPRILRVLEVSDRADEPYYVMPYLEGGSLSAQYRPDAPLATDQILSIAQQVAEALAHAHAHGIIHRDIKPGNVLLDKTGNAYLTDFGLVRTTDSTDEDVPSSAMPIEGSAPYLSPALARGEAEDTRCDIYAFGALLYELLAGRPPYAGRSQQMIINQILKGPPPPIRTINPKAHPGLVAIAEGCMAREVCDRYATIIDVLADLARIAHTGQPLGPKQCRRWWDAPRRRILASTAVLAVFGFALYCTRQPIRHLFRSETLRSLGRQEAIPVAKTDLSRGNSVLPNNHSVIQESALSDVGEDTGRQTWRAEYSSTTYLCATNLGLLTITKYMGSNSVVTIPESIGGLPVTAIGPTSFQGHTELSRVQLPDGITVIGDSAFRGCAGLASLTIPKSVTSLWATAFADCSRLTTLVVQAANSNYSSDNNGIIYNKDRTTLVRFPTGKAGSFTISAGVKSIGDNAFLTCHGLKAVTLLDGVADIGAGAFAECREMTNFNMSAGVTNIGAWAFNACTSLGRVSLPSGLLSVGDFSFGHCYALSEFSFPSTVQHIGSFCFCHCGGIKVVKISASVHSIGANPFRYCGALQRVEVDHSNPNYCDIGGVLFDKGRSQLLSFPCARDGRYDIPSGVTEVEHSAFRGAWRVKTVTFPESVTKLRFKSFWNCGSACSFFFYGNPPAHPKDVLAGCGRVSVYYRQGTVGWQTEYDGRPTGVWDPARPFSCSTNAGNLTIQKYISPEPVVAIPDSIDARPVVAVGRSAFRNCTHLTRLTVPASITQIDTEAFRDCLSLTEITLPAGLRNLGDSAFAGCTALPDITLPEPLTTLNRGLFVNCGALTNVVFPPALDRIEADVFSGCSCLPTLSLPNSLTSIGQGAFQRCVSLPDLTIPASVKSLYGNSFMFCHGLTSLVVQADNPVYQSVDGILFSKSRDALIRYPAGRSGRYAIPPGVATVANASFAGCTGLTAVAFSGSVTNIEGWAFQDCKDLGDLSLPDCLVSLGDRAFCNCPRIKRVTLPISLTNFHVNAFVGCVGVTSFDVQVANPAYCSSEGLLFTRSGTTLLRCPPGRTGGCAVPSGVTAVGDCAFESCGKITDLLLPPSVVSAGTCAFRFCGSLTNVSLSANMTSLGVEMFRDCGGVTSVRIPAKVASLGDRAFRNCPNLKSLWFEGDAPRLGRDVFQHGTNPTVYYRSGTKGWGREFGGRPTQVWNTEPPR